MELQIRDAWMIPAALLGAALAVWFWSKPANVPAEFAPVSAAPPEAVAPERPTFRSEAPAGQPLAARRAAPEVPLEELRTPFRLYGSARVSALYDRHEFLGVRVDEVDQGSLWDLVGVQSGDLVVEVNGELVNDPAAGVQLMNTLASDPVLLLRVRGVDGRERLLDFRFPAS